MNDNDLKILGDNFVEMCKTFNLGVTLSLATEETVLTFNSFPNWCVFDYDDDEKNTIRILKPQENNKELWLQKVVKTIDYLNTMEHYSGTVKESCMRLKQILIKMIEDSNKPVTKSNVVLH